MCLCTSCYWVTVAVVLVGPFSGMLLILKTELYVSMSVLGGMLVLSIVVVPVWVNVFVIVGIRLFRSLVLTVLLLMLSISMRGLSLVCRRSCRCVGEFDVKMKGVMWLFRYGLVRSDRVCVEGFDC